MNLTNCVLVAAILSPSATAQTKVAGYVADAHPAWVFPDGTPAQFPSPVVPGQVLHSSGKGAAVITIAYLDGTIDTKPCGQGPCEYRVKTVQPKSSLPEFLVALGNLFAHRDVPLVPAVTRSESPLRPQVLLLKESRLDLRDAVIHLDPGRYQVQLKPLRPAREQVTIVTASLSWESPDRTFARVPGLSPGLYELSLAAEDGQSMGRQIVLVSAPEDFAGKSEIFNRTRESLTVPPADANPTATLNMLNALLLELAS